MPEHAVACCFPLLFPISIQYGLTGRSGYGFAIRLNFKRLSEVWVGWVDFCAIAQLCRGVGSSEPLHRLQARV